MRMRMSIVVYLSDSHSTVGVMSQCHRSRVTVPRSDITVPSEGCRYRMLGMPFSTTIPVSIRASRPQTLLAAWPAECCGVVQLSLSRSSSSSLRYAHRHCDVLCLELWMPSLPWDCSSMHLQCHILCTGPFICTLQPKLELANTNNILVCRGTRELIRRT